MQAEQALHGLDLNQSDCVVCRLTWASDFMAKVEHFGDDLMKQRSQPFLLQELKPLGAMP